MSRRTPSSGLYQKVPISAMLPLTGYSSPMSLKMTEPISLFVDSSSRRSVFKIADACLILGYTPPQMFDYLKRTGLKAFSSMTAKDIEDACRYTSEHIRDEFSLVIKRLKKWKEEKLKEIKEKFGKKDKSVIFKQQTTRINNQYDSLQENIKFVYKWIEKKYPEIAKDIKWAENN